MQKLHARIEFTDSKDNSADKREPRESSRQKNTHHGRTLTFNNECLILATVADAFNGIQIFKFVFLAFETAHEQYEIVEFFAAATVNGIRPTATVLRSHNINIDHSGTLISFVPMDFLLN